MQYMKPNIFGSKNILNSIVGSNIFTPNVGTLKVYPTWVYRLAIDVLGKTMTYRMEDVQLVVHHWRIYLWGHINDKLTMWMASQNIWTWAYVRFEVDEN